ncbi:MAG TPA: chemotaxis protein CheA [Polyangia bacterium]|nr:chemotaxis protein CheA [Polyangia bacterium]
MDLDRDVLLQTFLEETQENLAQMEQALVALEASPSDDEAIRAVFRGAHTIKGNAATLGFRAVAEFAHAFEDVLARVRERALAPSTALTSLLLRALDVLREAVPLAVEGAEALPPASEAVREALARAREGALDEGRVAPAGEEARSSPDEHAPLGGGEGRVLEGRTLRVDVDRLDRMLRLAGEIAISRGRLRELLDRDAAARDALETHREADRLFLDLQEQIMEARLVPLGPVFRRHQRTVRDVGLAVGKQVALVVEGDEVEVDMAVVEHLRDPLTHMIRNAIDHGIEAPEARARLGKDPCGRITLRARRDSGSIVMEVEDDGAGLDLERIREVGAARGFDTARMRDADLRALIFASGFSTAATVTDLSGRGVGMEVVRRNVDLLRGTIAVESRPGQGTTISVRVPLTLAIIDGFQVQIGGGGGQTYVIPLDTVVECMELQPSSGERADDHGVIDVRGEAVPFLRLGGVFGLGAGDGEPRARENVVVVKHEDRLAGIAVDALLGQSQTVIKPLSKMFRGLPGVAGSTILGNGRVALILDVPALLREATGRRSAGAGPGPGEAAP